ncbi:hypothetical protein [Aquiflexum sp.]|uniref:hypothetical protein n=1 Tax=Aquiflexum sp. TaxID=1872584 RepID=UPI0035944904
MKKIVLIFVTFLFTIAITHAQELRELKGPAAKNYKPWKHQQKSSVVILNVNPSEKKGPEFKNVRIWKDDSEVVAINLETKSQERKTGSGVKNRKPWTKN